MAISIINIAGHVATLITQILLVVLIAAGYAPDRLANMNLFNVNVEDLSAPSRITSPILSALQSLSSQDLTGGVLSGRDLQLAREYIVFVYRSCRVDNVENTSCGDFEVGYYFNPFKTLRLENTGLDLEQDFPNNAYEDTFDFYKSVSYYLGVGLLICMAFSLLVGIFGLIAAKFEKAKYGVVALSTLSSLLLLASTVLAFRVSHDVVDAIKNSLDIGISAEIGSANYLLIGATIVSLLALAMHLLTMHKAGTHARMTRRQTSDGKIQYTGPPTDPSERYGNGKKGFKNVLPWKRHKYVQVNERQRAFEMTPMGSRDQSPMPPRSRSQSPFVRPNRRYE